MSLRASLKSNIHIYLQPSYLDIIYSYQLDHDPNIEIFLSMSFHIRNVFVSLFYSKKLLELTSHNSLPSQTL